MLALPLPLPFSVQEASLEISNLKPVVLMFRIFSFFLRLEIRQVGEGINHVPGLVEAHVNNMTEVWEVLQTGSNARAVGSTNANEHSSRSHWSVFLIFNKLILINI